MNLFLGIDPGESGAFAIVDSDNNVLELHDFHSFLHFFEFVSRIGFKGAAMESVRLWGIESAQAGTTFMKNAGGEEAILQCLQIRHVMVEPQTWQKSLGVSIAKSVTKGLESKEAAKIRRKDKERLKQKSIEVASKYYGIQEIALNHGKADALNVARYAMEVFGR